jgi:lysophospholipase L1-like esterase
MNRYTDQPDIMAIGDSLYQGIRSLSFLPAMTQHSAPAQVAAALGMEMVVPDLHVPLLFDLEAELRKGGLISLVEHIRNVCVSNLTAWDVNQPWSQHEAFDNVAIGGAGIASLTDDTYDVYFEQVVSLSAALRDPNLGLAATAKTIGSLWYALNTCYTLNPRHLPAQRNKSQLDQVKDRQPSILLINIGSNEGLFAAGFAGDVGPKARQHLADIPTLLVPIADRLKELPARVERIVFNNLIRPRFVPNLMPSPQHENDYPGDLYYQAYGPRIGSTDQDISGTDLESFDKLVADVNEQAKALLKGTLGDKAVFADLYGGALHFDGKHYLGRGLTIPGRGRTLTNKPITPLPFTYYGGFAGLDNMHPTVPGYAVIADLVLAALGRSLQTDKAAAYAADTLLGNPPGLAMLIPQMELSLLGLFGVFRGADESAPPSAPAPVLVAKETAAVV